jgi:hypothetical protein
MAWNAIIETSTGDLLRHGFTTVVAGAGETELLDHVRPPEPKVRGAGPEFSRWDGSAWQIIADPDQPKALAEAAIKNALFADPLEGFLPSVVAVGLQITVDVDPVIVGDVTNVVADPTDTKFILVSMSYNQGTDLFAVVVREKTTGAYADLESPDEILVDDLKEFSLVASGTTLVEV